MATTSVCPRLRGFLGSGLLVLNQDSFRQIGGLVTPGKESQAQERAGAKAGGRERAWCVGECPGGPCDRRMVKQGRQEAGPGHTRSLEE